MSPEATNLANSATTRRLLSLLADGRPFTESQLTSALGLGRDAVQRHLGSLAELGIAVRLEPEGGYRLATALEVLEPARIRAAMSVENRRQVAGLEVHLRTDSTNSAVRRQAGPDPSGTYACLAEVQTAGRGRRGRTWVSPPGGNIYLSVLWRFASVPPDPAGMGALGLAMGVAGLRALRDTGVEGGGLKWPNDLHHGGAKLAGILIERSGAGQGPGRVVVGIGVNGVMPAGPAAGIDQPWTDLAGILGAAPSRNRLAGRLLHHLISALREYEALGLAPFLDEYRRHDLLAGKAVTVKAPHGDRVGIASGIDERGALRLRVGGGERRIEFGEVSVRADRGEAPG